MARNYYVILGVSRDASQGEIRQAYRQRALELHPDRAGGDTEPFQNVQEAYSVLNDPKRRRTYDRSIVESNIPVDVDTESTRRPAAEPLDRSGFSDLGARSVFDDYETIRSSRDAFADWLGRNFAGIPFGEGIHSKGERPKPLHVEILLSPEEARRGGRVRVGIPVRSRCRTCGGSGRLAPFRCTFCDGTGIRSGEQSVWVPYPAGIRSDWTTSLSLEDIGVTNLYLVADFRVTAG